ncbi:MAG: hypothetical protein R3C12_05900 [Planctomycetaceae bacterium]
MPKDYPLFIPPKGFAETTPKEWTKREADAYMRWLMDTVEGRVSALLSYLGEETCYDPEDLLLRVGKKVEILLRLSVR